MMDPDPASPNVEPPPPPLPRARAVRPPVPAMMWVGFCVGPIVVFALAGLIVALINFHRASDMVAGVWVGGLTGVFSVPFFAGGTALAGHFFGTNGARAGGALLFALLLIAGIGGLAFAGCMCLVNSGPMH